MYFHRINQLNYIHMKMVFFFLSLCTGVLFAQLPQAFNYQAAVRNSGGVLLINQSVSIQVSIIKSSISSPPVYVERHTTTTNAYGIVTLSVGAGTVQSGTFSTIDWATDNSFIKIEIDPAGGTSYTDMGTSQLLSVPYAMVAGDIPDVITVSGSLNNMSYSGFTSTFQHMEDIMTFTKVDDRSDVEISFQSRVSTGTFAGGATGFCYEIRVDDQPAPGVSGQFCFTTPGIIDRVHHVVFFQGLPAGTHTVNIYARSFGGGTISGVLTDSGGWRGRVVVREIR